MNTDGRTRRGVMATILMAAGAVAGYGLGVVHFFRFLVPLGRNKTPRERFIGTLENMPVGSSRTITIPNGQQVAVTRLFDDVERPARGFRALSSVCPHLGCRVHWESGRDRYYCPCHQGVFDREGKAVSGPPAKEGKDLTTFPVKVDREKGWVFVLVSGDPSYDV